MIFYPDCIYCLTPFRYMNIGLPMMSRDFLLRAYGADCLASHGKIIILGGFTMNAIDKSFLIFM